MARISDGRGGEDTAARPAQERIVGLLAVGETFEDGFERVEHGDRTVSAALGLLDDEAASAGIATVVPSGLAGTSRTTPPR